MSWNSPIYRGLLHLKNIEVARPERRSKKYVFQPKAKAMGLLVWKKKLQFKAYTRFLPFNELL